MRASRLKMFKKLGIALVSAMLLLIGCTPFGKRPAAISSKADEQLMDAACNGGEVGVKDALKAGANPNSHNQFGGTPLMCAAEKGYLTITKTLRDVGADINLTHQSGWTALMWASQNHHVDLVLYLLEESADPNITAKDGTTALWATIDAVSNFNEEGYKVIMLLLKHGANPQVKKNGNSPIEALRNAEFVDHPFFGSTKVWRDKIVQEISSHTAAK